MAKVIAPVKVIDAFFGSKSSLPFEVLERRRVLVERPDALELLERSQRSAERFGSVQLTSPETACLSRFRV
jgi:hypothetical protein